MRVALLTSGGDAPGMNAAIRAVVRSCLKKGMDVYGIYQGYHGLIEGDIEHLQRSSVADIIQKGGTILRTARSAAFKTPEGRKKAKEVLDNLGIEALVVIGGDGTLKGAYDLATETGLKIYALPATIDNDVAYSEKSIGFDTAVNTALTAISNIRDTSTAMGRTTIIEVMGRKCGDLALFAGLAGGAEKILIPELSYDVASVASQIIAGIDIGKRHSIIIKAEGVGIPTEKLAKELEEKTGAETKTVLLGYIQRGGSPSAEDRILASRLGHRVAELVQARAESSAVGIFGDEITVMSLKDAVEKKRVQHLEFIEICKDLL